MIYSLLLPAYITAFAILFEKMGFRWKWFLPLAAAFVIATLFTLPWGDQGLFRSIASAKAEDRIQLLTTPMFLIFCPIHALVTVRVMKAIPGNSPVFQRMVVKLLVYIASAWAAGFIFMLFGMIGFSLYYLAIR